MNSLDRALVESRALGFLSALLLPGLLVVGCVSLTKPLEVQKCSEHSTCSDDPNSVPPSGSDAKKDTVDNPSPDLPFVEETPIAQPDAGPDVSPSVPDGPSDTSDTAPGNKDSGDTFKPADAADALPPPADVPVDKVTGPESGPEPQGAEPSSGPEPSSKPEPSTGPEPSAKPEPGPEPGPEAGPEPGPEPVSEPGREPGPEPPPDGGAADSAPASNCTIASGTQSRGPNSTAAFCLATCDDIQGWNCNNFAGRTLTINGVVTTCAEGSSQPALTKKNGYNVFQASAGTSVSAVVTWWGTANASCPAPDGGVFP